MSRTVLIGLLLMTGCSGGLQPMTLDDTSIPDDDVPLPGDDDDDDDSVDTDTQNPGTNAAPVADAGDDQDVLVAQVANLDGSASYDPDGDPVDYAWEMVSRPANSTAYLINQTRVNPSFFVDRPGEYLIELVVDDGDLYSQPDTVLITAEAPNEGPVANAGPDQFVDVGDHVQLNGASSYDPEGDPITFEWTFTSRPPGSSATLLSATSSLPSFTADVDGVFVVRLVVSDGSQSSPPDEVRITAQASSDSDCISCAQAQLELERQWRAGDVASSFGLVLLPIVVLLAQRRRERD